MTGVIKSLVKGVKSIFRGVKKIFKKITSSTIGKVLLAAAVIYLTGGAFGLWNTPFASVNGAFVSGTKAAAVAAGGDVAALPVVTEAAAAGAEGLTAAGVAGTAAPTAAAAIPTLAPTAVSETLMAGMPSALPGATGVAKTGILSKMAAGAGKVAGFAGEHPMAAAMGLSAIASGLAPDEEDLLSLRDKILERRQKRAYGGIGDINIGVRPSGNQNLLDISGAPVYEGGSLLARLRANRKVGRI